MSPEQSIIVAKSCDYYQKCDNTKKYPAGYLLRYDSCKNCANWNLGRCERAQDILRSID
ncbi:MAG: hypothetical protein ACOX15_07540 [Tepidanaerobacteraceae bacterium]|jgi:hypothetical protein